jgi:uncharacterized protein (TIGR00304 family)
LSPTELLSLAGIALIFVGILIIIIAIILLGTRSTAKGENKSKVSAGGVVMIGPIPIIFGTDKKALKTVVWLAFALTILLIIAMIVYYLILR